MKLVHLSDLHLTEPGVRLDGLDTNARFVQALTHALAEHGDAERIVITGDLTHWADAAAYAALRDAIEMSPVPVRLLIGNHDDRAAFLAAFPDHPRDDNGFVNHAETVNGIRMIYCDSTAPLTHTGHFCAARRDWLAAELEAADRAMVFFHHNPLDLGDPAKDLIALNADDQASLHPLLKAYRARILHIFFGHAHLPLSGTCAGIPFSGVPSTALQSIPDLAPGTLLKGARMDPAYRVVLLRGDDIVIHQIPFAWDGPVRTAGTRWEDWVKPAASR